MSLMLKKEEKKVAELWTFSSSLFHIVVPPIKENVSEIEKCF